MNGSFRQSMTWLHTWCGLVFCWLLYFLFVTGTLGYFDTEIDRWMTPEVAPAAPSSLEENLTVAQRRLEEVAPEADRWFVTPTRRREAPHLRIFAQQRAPSESEVGDRVNEELDLRTGLPVAKGRETGGGQTLYRMHYRLHYLPGESGFYLIAFVTMVMFVGLLTGIVAHKKIFADFFTFRWARGQRSWLDLHNLLAVATLPFQLMITYSGLIFTVFLWMPFIALGSYGFNVDGIAEVQEELLGGGHPEHLGTPEPLLPLTTFADAAVAVWGEGSVRSIEVLRPGDASAQVNVQRVAGVGTLSEVLAFDGGTGAMLSERDAAPNAPLAFGSAAIGLHEGLFAGPLLRWLYFLSGVLGAAMIATGAIYWVVKRKPKTAGADTGLGYRFVENMNVATIVGFLVAIGAYFWANRLLPVGMEARADWEVHCLFLAWGLALVHAIVRPRERAWVEQCAACAVVFLGLPILNALTTSTHLGETIARGDWVLAGFDLTALATGAVAALAAVALHRRWRWRPAREWRGAEVASPGETGAPAG